MKILAAHKEKLVTLANRLIDTDIELDSLWRLSEKGFLYVLFKEDTSDCTNYLTKFEKVVTTVLTRKMDSNHCNSKDVLTTGKWLCFDPTVAMYDGLAEIESMGFFDSDDLPPPEFWVGYFEKKLISFIPQQFLDYAVLGVDSSMSGSLSWCEL
jgi:hypothetical protein